MTFTSPNSAGFPELDEANAQSSYAWLDVAARRGNRKRKRRVKEVGWTDVARAAALAARRAKGLLRRSKSVVQVLTPSERRSRFRKLRRTRARNVLGLPHRIPS